jgi:GNAT superfamily N-acetyltransferase
MGLLVRRIRPSDLVGLLALYDDLAEGNAARAPAEEATSREVLEAILADPYRQLAVAVRDGQLVGTADLLVVPNLTHHGKPWAVIENVVVASRLRRTGVGRELVQHLIELARAAGCYKVQLLSGKQRVAAHNFYESVGFQPVAEGFKIYFDR